MGQARRNSFEEVGYEARRRHRNGHRLVHRQHHPGGAGLPARSEIRHHARPRTTPNTASAARCTARPTLNPEELGRPPRHALPRRRHGLEPRGHGSGDRRCRPEADDISNERTGIIMGSGGPSTRTIIDAADITREKGPKRIGPFAVPKAMSSTASATLATWFKIKGVNYSISSACATSNHCIGNAYEMIQYGQAGRDVRRRLRGSRLDHVEPVRRHGRHVHRSTTTRPPRRLARL